MSNSVLHPTRPIVAYSTGCMVIVYDLISDQKIQLINHQYEVQAISFSAAGAANSTMGGEFLITVDLDPLTNKSVMCLWNWTRGLCLQ